MNPPDFDVIIVGGGIAGSCSALLLARAGLRVLLLERGAQAGSKNVSGGRLYSEAFSRCLLGFTENAPLERQITQEKFSVLNAENSLSFDYRHAAHPKNASYSVLRARFDPWLMGEAEKAGAQCLCGVLVDELIVELIVENGQKKPKIIGIKTGGEALYARAVILAEGANTLLAEQHQLCQKPAPQSMAIGVKEVRALPRTTLEERFSLEQHAGCAWLFAGSAAIGVNNGGGFLYTNQESISLGLVCPMSSFSAHESANHQLRLPDALECFKQHALLKPLLSGSELMEYSAHLIPETGFNPQQAFGAGYLLVGDSARCVLNAGYTVRGMDLALLSAEAAAATLIAAQEKNDFGQNSLAAYAQHLHSGALFNLLKRQAKIPKWLHESPHLLRDYPQFALDLAQAVYAGHDATDAGQRVWRTARQFGWLRLLKDALKGLRQ